MSILSTQRAIGRTTALTLALLASLVVGACGGGAVASTSGRTSLSVGLGYIPSVQFAPFYLADQRGDYAAAGLDVSPAGVAKHLTGLMDAFLVETSDLTPALAAALTPHVRKSVAAPIVMADDAARLAVARAVLAVS